MASHLMAWLSPPPPPPPPSGFDFLINFFFGLFSSPPPPPPPRPTGHYFYAFIALVVAAHAWEQYLRWRTMRRLRQPGVPPAVREALGGVDDAEYAKMQAYSSAKNSFGFISDFVGLAETGVSLFLSPYLWNGIGLRATLALGLTAEHEIARMFLVSLISMPLDLALSLPLSAYSTFVIEERYGFNNHTVRSWLADTAKGQAVNLVLSVFLIAPLILVLRNLGDSAWLYAWALITCSVLVLNMVYPTAIAPLFNTFKPLPAGPVREGIESLVTSSGISCDKIFEVDGSKQSAHSNACAPTDTRAHRTRPATRPATQPANPPATPPATPLHRHAPHTRARAHTHPPPHVAHTHKAPVGGQPDAIARGCTPLPSPSPTPTPSPSLSPCQLRDRLLRYQAHRRVRHPRHPPQR